ncbi:AAA ATPase-like protein [Nonomuraea polychroma]|uniref:AAA ATPase-like protein n=1 Tax=Nonomuraea polychroma TaxID=46176 RepID=A0A438MJI6_9ACTN|nr:AAA family ATPase [Nonomuraea polychroma]RVX45561.1 AAA ATPase-like protein [Nonomuraea polychroma]
MPMDTAAHELIGRDHPAALLRAEIARLIASHGGLVLVTGEAGIGKTTLVTSAAREARRQGALVVGGACWDSASAPGYWPWTQVIRALRRGAEPEEWAAAESAAGPSLAALLGDQTSHEDQGNRASPFAPVSPSGAEVPDTFKLYDAVTSALVALAQRRPVVIVIDDLHVADPASLRLLEFAAQQTWFERVLLIGTYRDAEVEPVDHPLRALLSPLGAKATTTITLTGLDETAVAALMARTVGEQPPPGLVAEVHRRTGGNPFFVEQTARLWSSGGSADAIAPGVRDALLRRLSLLPRPVAELLPAAAVLGREFHRQVLAATIEAPVAHVDRLLELAVVAKLVVTKGGGVFAFAHDLVRETLYDSLDDPGERHAAVVAALDRWPAGERSPALQPLEGSTGLDGKVLPSDLARHAYLAGDRVDPGRATDLLLAAARDARGRMAGEEQLGHLRRAHELSAAADPRTHAIVALELGKELHHHGDDDEARRLFEQAAAIAGELDDAELSARVALTFRSYYGRDKAFDRLRQAHARLVGSPAPDERLALDLVVRLAQLARQGGDDDALAFSLWAHHDIIWGPGTARERVALTGELIDLARRTSDPELEHFARALRWVAMIEQGDPRYLDQFQDYAANARRSEQPHFLMTMAIDESILAAFAGRFAEAESLLSGIRLDSTHDHMDFMLSHHRWAMSWLRGRVEEQEKILDQLRTTAHPCVGVLEALTALQAGDPDLALRRLATEQPHDGNPAGTKAHDGSPAAVGNAHDGMSQPLWLRLQAEVAASTQDLELCAAARAALSPHRGQWAVALFGWDVSGPYDLWLAKVDAAEGRWAEAVTGFTAACRSADRMGARPWSVLARAHLAEALFARAAPGDAEAAQTLLDGVRQDAAELGMRHVLESVRPSRTPSATSPPDDPRPRPDAPGRGGALGLLGNAWTPLSVRSTRPDQPGEDTPGTRRDGTKGEFRRDGAVWSLMFSGRAAHMPDAKGLRDLHILLSRPGEDVPAVRLLNPEGGEVVLAARRMGGDDMLDEEAKTRYRRRLTQLDEEIDRAVGRGDDGRAAEFDRERAALLEELRAAAGLGGRTRRLGDEAERARKTVTARIRDVLRKLDHAHPELAAHLRASISTGSTCRYQPEDETAWRL